MTRPRTLNQLCEMFAWPPPRDRDVWRMLWPASGTLIGERVTILATNGILAAFTKNWEELTLGHLANFVGPTAKEEVWEEDWDWKLNMRRMEWSEGFPRPVDSVMAAHWERHQKASKEWLELEAAIGRGLMPPEDFQKSWQALCKKKIEPRTAAVRTAKAQRLQALMDMI